MATLYTYASANREKSFLLIGLFLILIIGLGWVFARAFDSPVILYVAVAVSIAQAWISYYYSDKITLAISGAQRLAKKDDPSLYRLVENLAITAGLPTPAIYVIDDTAPNAFATGRDPNHAAIAVTSGLLTKLGKPELQGVLAHELSHVGNYDTRVMTIVVTLVGIVALLSDWFLRFTFYSRGDRRRGEGGAAIMLLALVLALLSPLFATLIQLAVSRKREYLADATGALLTRFPDGLADALEKIAQDKEPLEAANKATAHLYIANPFREGRSGPVGWFAQLFDTHPPVAERIRILRALDVGSSR